MRFRSFALIVVGLVVTGPAGAADYLAMSGKQLYWRFCAACHGEGGRGDGPVAAVFKSKVPDLTLIATRPSVSLRAQIAQSIDGRTVVGAHGTRTMPVWGEDFSRAFNGDPNAEAATAIVIDRLAEYVVSLQRPAGP